MPRVFQQEASKPLAGTLQSTFGRFWCSFDLWRSATSKGVPVENATKLANTRVDRKRMLRKRMKD